MTARLLKSTATVSGMTLISRVLGFVRDVLIARYFGASLGTDAFFVAFKIPNFMRRLFAEGAFSQAFVPVLSDYQTNGREGELKGFVDRVTGTLGLVLAGVTIVGILAAPVFITVFAPGFRDDATKFDLAVDMLRLTFPYLLFISLTALAGGILNAFGRFAVPAFTPVFLNLCMIGAAVWLAPMMDEPVTALAWGVLLAGIVQLGFQLPFLARLRLLPRPRPDKSHPGVRRVGKLMVPALFGVSVTQINLLIDTMLASFLVTGSVSWLYYSDRLVEFPLGIFGIALATVILPGLSRDHAGESPAQFSATLDWALRWVVVIVPASAVGLMVLSGPILATLFQYEQFTGHDTLMATRSLMAYSLGLLGFVLIKVLATGFFARQDTKTPVRIGVIAMFCNIALNLALIGPLAHAGLALATSLAAMLNASLLFRGLRREQVYQPRAGWRPLFARILLANMVMATLLLLLVDGSAQWTAWGVWERSGRLLGLIAAGGVAYAATLLLAGLRPAHLVAAGE